MLAILLRLTVGAFLSGIAVCLWLIVSSDVVLGLAGIGVLTAGYASVLAAEFAMLWRAGSRHPGIHPAPVDVLIRAWAAEVREAACAFGWRMPFRPNAFLDQVDPLPPAAGGCVGVILVHGFVCNRGLWNRWMQRLGGCGIPFIAVNLEPVFGSIDEYVDIIERAVHRMTEATGTTPVVVAHSMGGLAVRCWLARREAASRVRRVITIGTPHQGTAVARFGLFPSTREMRIGSAWLEALARSERAPVRALFTCFFSHCDNVVFPVARAVLPGADNRHVPGMAHLQLLASEAVFSEVLQWLTRPGWERCEDRPPRLGAALGGP